MTLFPRFRRWTQALWLSAMCGLLGCSEGTPPSKAPAVADPPVAESPFAGPLAADRREYWDAIYFEDKKVGYAHTVSEPVTQGGRALVRTTAESELAIQRFAQITRQRLQFSSLETPSGEVVRFENSMSSGDGNGSAAMKASGEVRGNEIALRLTTLGKTEGASIPWDKEWGGYFAMEQSLERQPLKAGERRSLRALFPGFNQVADVEFVARDLEAVDMLDGSPQLLRVECRIKLGQTNLEQTVWTDRDGQVLKTFMPAMQQTSYRTTKERALAKGTGTFDLGERTIVKVARALEDPHATRRVRYRATVKSGEALGLFVASGTQLVQPVASDSVDILVRSLGVNDPLGSEFPADAPPAEDDLLPNSLIQSDDEQIQRLSREVAPEATNKWEIAVALERHVRDLIENKGFTQALSSAAEVIRSREGDCTEHAVLLSALCRARGIPSRVVIGLVYYQPAGGFAYHMWSEVWIEDRWLPLDATLGQGGIGAAHLAVSRSNLKGVDPLTQFLPVLQLIGNLSLEIVEVE